MDDIKILEVYNNLKQEYPYMCLDELLYKLYNKINFKNETFDSIKKEILKVLNIDEYEYYTKNVNNEIKNYVNLNVFPKYERNDKAHGIIHIKEVIRRAFVLNDSLKLNLNDDIIFVISAYHDLGKYIDHNTHEKIAADLFITDKVMEQFFTLEERKVIKEAIEDHRSSYEDIPRSIYGKLISSADRNTTIEMVFIRSFFVAQARMPEMDIEEYLNFTYNRLYKRYNGNTQENMFLEDETYKNFLNDMQNLLKEESKFKDIYCNVNKIYNRNLKVKDYIN